MSDIYKQINDITRINILNKISSILLNDMYEKTQSEKILNVIVKDYICLYLNDNINAKKTLEDSLELCRDIFISRLDSSFYQYDEKKESLNSICYNILNSIVSPKLNSDKIDIKSGAKLISYLKINKNEVKNIFDEISKELIEIQDILKKRNILYN